MKKICIFSAILLLMLCLCGCRRVAVTKADELVLQSWSAQTKSGMGAELVFSENTASFTVYGSNGEQLSLIEGVFEIDNSNLYITDSRLYKTYSFGYKVYGDKAEFEYAGEILTFYPFSEAASTAP